MIFMQSDFFSGMDPAFVKAIMENAEEAAYQAGDMIFREGDQTRYFYILINGHVKLSIGRRDGHTVFIINRAGECFGWSSLINRDRYSASAVCAAPTTLMRLEKTQVLTVMGNRPDAGLIFMQRLAEIISDRLMMSYRTLGSLALLASHPSEGTGQVQEALEPA